MLSPSMFTFMGRLHELIQDPAFVQVSYVANDHSVAGLPHDLFVADGAKIHLRYTDLTAGAAVATVQAWVIQGGYGSSQETWIPRIMVRRTGDQEPLASCFVGVIEPYSRQSAIKAVSRLVPTVDGQAMPDGNVALRVDLAEGRADLVVALDVENPLSLRPSLADGLVHVPAWELATDAELCLVRLDAAGQVQRVARRRRPGRREMQSVCLLVRARPTSHPVA